MAHAINAHLPFFSLKHSKSKEDIWQTHFIIHTITFPCYSKVNPCPITKDMEE